MRQRRLDQIEVIIQCIDALASLPVSLDLKTALAAELDSINIELKASIIKLVPTKKGRLQ